MLLAIITISIFYNLWFWVNPFFSNLDPSLFLNITLGSLAIFIPFAIIFLTKILNSKEATRSEFEKMVLNDEVFGVKKIFWFAIFSIVFFAFFSGTDISIFAKIISIFAALIFIYLFSIPLYKILNFSEGDKTKFEINFLENLKFSKILGFRNEKISKKMVRAWKSFWPEKLEFNEGWFTWIFISHIDSAIKYRKLYTANQLSKAYVKNIEQRDKDFVVFRILPKIFEWHKQQFLIKHNTERENYFLDYYYFSGEFFQKVTETLLKDRNSTYQFFPSFEDYINKSIREFNKIRDREKKEEYYQKHIHSFFNSFCPTFFNGIKNAPLGYEIQNNLFPPKWKIAMKNTKKGVPNIIPNTILRKFLQWSNERIPINSERINFKKDSEKVIKCIFPSVDPFLFTSFLRLLFLGEIKPALEEDLYFSTLDYPINAFNRERNNEDRQEQIFEMMDKDIEARKKETINIIFTFFSPYWGKLRITLDDNNKDEWNNANNEKRALMLKKARKEKLGKIKEELESGEIRKICENDEVKESDRGIFLTLINLLLKEIEKQKS